MGRNRALEALSERWRRISNRGDISEDATVLSSALRLAAEQYERDAALADQPHRVRMQFGMQAAQCRVIAEAIEP